MIKQSRIYTDQELANGLFNGDEYAFQCIYERYAKALYRSAYQLLNDKELCEDLIQELFINLWIKRDVLHISSLKPYLYISMKNQVLMAVRRKKYLLNEELLLELKASETIEDYVHTKELQQSFQKEIDLLPKRCKEIFSLSRIEQLSNREIAERLQISIKTVENQMTIALRAMRIFLQHFLLLTIFLFPF
ncbi:RNA polymerase sigma factor [Olivibacter domesticus]|uniref:RNA polymerase sigma-70 factor, ECF subfamily n=1 Tax=Olivibacter domesticus TaxID=407022 RepID=A0A1H7UUA2_OLID1|nr:RNA polymerase sigma-70 factor [Olivibacter domesticus]SEM00553.1 RNA polymerase sigma-70 factor, ECF subfamily [Olivibacter domesticus]